jgi:hypothetical protein
MNQRPCVASVHAATTALSQGANSLSADNRHVIVTESWNRVVAVPYLAYMPELDRLIMLVSLDHPHRPAVIASDDRGQTWTAPRRIPSSPADPSRHEVAVALTYLGAGRLVCGIEGRSRYFSADYGETWEGPVPIPAAIGDTPPAQWDPWLVDHDPATGEVLRVAETGYVGNEAAGCQAFLRFSRDQGRTWDPAIVPPQWRGVDEVALCRAANGCIVAACRTDTPERFKGQIDHYEGLASSVSTDNGLSWTVPTRLYEYGRHHPSMVLLPGGTLVMTYVVRIGYEDTAEGLPRFGIEATVSRDNGITWDLDGRIVLAEWPGTRSGPDGWMASSQSTSTLLLPDDTLLTAYGTGYRNEIGDAGYPTPRDVGLVWWRA